MIGVEADTTAIEHLDFPPQCTTSTAHQCTGVAIAWTVVPCNRADAYWCYARVALHQSELMTPHHCWYCQQQTCFRSWKVVPL